MFWNPEVITTTGKSLRITQIQFNIIYIMRTNINQGRIQSLAVMIVLLINNDQNPISYLIPYSRLNRSCNLNTLVSTTSYPLYGINAAISAIADKKEDLKSFEVGNIKPHASSTCGLYGLPAIFHTQHALSIAIAFIT